MSTGSDRPDRPVTRAPQQPAQPGPGTGDPDRPAPAPAGPRDDSRPRGGGNSSGTSPETRPGTKPETGPGGTAPAEQPESETRGGGKTAGLWLTLILGAIILILLLIFVIQNNVTAQFQYFNAQFDLPLGVAMLLAAIAGALVMALVGSVRMVQMSWTIRKLRKSQQKIHQASR